MGGGESGSEYTKASGVSAAREPGTPFPSTFQPPPPPPDRGSRRTMRRELVISVWSPRHRGRRQSLDTSLPSSQILGITAQAHP